MSEAEQSRKPQRDKSKEPTASTQVQGASERSDTGSSERGDAASGATNITGDPRKLMAGGSGAGSDVRSEAKTAGDVQGREAADLDASTGSGAKAGAEVEADVSSTGKRGADAADGPAAVTKGAAAPQPAAGTAGGAGPAADDGGAGESPRVPRQSSGQQAGTVAAAGRDAVSGSPSAAERNERAVAGRSGAADRGASGSAGVTTAQRTDEPGNGTALAASEPPVEGSTAPPKGVALAKGRTPDEAGAGTSTAGGTPAKADEPASKDERSGQDGKPGRGVAVTGGRSGRAGSGRDHTSGSGRQDSEGRLLAGRYRLGGVLGRGGMGTVWRAEDETLGRTVAVKELRFPNSIDEEEKRRLITRTLREAKAIARIRNNNAVTVYDVVEEDDRPWIVMELVEGKSLAEAVREDGTLTPRRAAEVGLAILDVLRSAHREGILHRDVKPSNVLIAEDGRVVLTDFGIAQVEGDPSITSTGMLVGAPSYISPERARGHRPGPAADLWSLGGLIYASVEGCPPYDKGSAIATLTAVMTEPLDPPKNAGPLVEVIYGLLAKDPEQRLDDAGARALLTQVLHAPEPVPEPPQDATRAMVLPTVPPSEQPTPAKPSEPAAERMRGALQAVRSAAAAAVKPETGTGPEQQSAVAQPPKPATPPVQRAGAGRASLTDVVPRRTLVIIAVVVALAVIAGVVYAVASRDDTEKNEGKQDTNAAAGATGGAGTKETDPAAKQSPGANGKDQPKGNSQSPADKGDSTEPATKPTPAAPADNGIPAGYAKVSNDQFKFTIAMPKGFKRTGTAGQSSGAIFSKDGGFPRLQVDFNSSPKADAAAAWAAAVAIVRATSNGYKHLGIKTVEYNGYPTVADWEFERNQKGERVRILNRGFKVDATHGYSIMITCKKDEWDGAECDTLRKTAFATFAPKD